MPAVETAAMWVNCETRSKSTASRVNRDAAPKLSSWTRPLDLPLPLDDSLTLGLAPSLIEVIEVSPSGLQESFEEPGSLINFGVNAALVSRGKPAFWRHVVFHEVAVHRACGLERVIVGVPVVHLHKG